MILMNMETNLGLENYARLCMQRNQREELPLRNRNRTKWKLGTVEIV